MLFNALWSFGNLYPSLFLQSPHLLYKYVLWWHVATSPSVQPLIEIPDLSLLGLVKFALFQVVLQALFVLFQVVQCLKIIQKYSSVNYRVFLKSVKIS